MTPDAPTDSLDGLLDQPTREPALDDEDAWLIAPARRRRLPKLTAALAAGILLAAAFTGGVLVQKHHDRSLNASGAAAGLSGGFPSGAFPGLGSSSPAAGTGDTGTNDSGDGTGPAVIGTVVAVHGRVVTVRNLAGRTIRVTVPDSATVTAQHTVALSSLVHGRSVVVTGTTGTDGTVTATDITAR